MKLSKTSVDLLEDEIRKTVGKDPKEGVTNFLRVLSSELAYHKEHEMSRLVDRLLDGLELPPILTAKEQADYKMDLHLLTSQLHKTADSREWENMSSVIQALSLYLSHMDSRAEAAADRLYDVLARQAMRAPRG